MEVEHLFVEENGHSVVQGYVFQFNLIVPGSAAILASQTLNCYIMLHLLHLSVHRRNFQKSESLLTVCFTLLKETGSHVPCVNR